MPPLPFPYLYIGAVGRGLGDTGLTLRPSGTFAICDSDLDLAELVEDLLWAMAFS